MIQRQIWPMVYSPVVSGPHVGPEGVFAETERVCVRAACAAAGSLDAAAKLYSEFAEQPGAHRRSQDAHASMIAACSSAMQVKLYVLVGAPACCLSWKDFAGPQCWHVMRFDVIVFLPLIDELTGSA